MAKKRRAGTSAEGDLPKNCSVPSNKLFMMTSGNWDSDKKDRTEQMVITGIALEVAWADHR